MFQLLIPYFLLLFVQDQLVQKVNSFYFSEYKFTFRSKETCINEEELSTINGSRYLKVKILNDCELAEVSCYNSYDSTLIEKGVYYNTYQVKKYSVRSRQAGAGNSSISERQFFLFKRTGIWSFYNKKGELIREVKY